MKHLFSSQCSRQACLLEEFRSLFLGQRTRRNMSSQIFELNDPQEASRKGFFLGCWPRRPRRASGSRRRPHRECKGNRPCSPLGKWPRIRRDRQVKDTNTNTNTSFSSVEVPRERPVRTWASNAMRRDGGAPPSGIGSRRGWCRDRASSLAGPHAALCRGRTRAPACCPRTTTTTKILRYRRPEWTSMGNLPRCRRASRRQLLGNFWSRSRCRPSCWSDVRMNPFSSLELRKSTVPSLRNEAT